MGRKRVWPACGLVWGKWEPDSEWWVVGMLRSCLKRKGWSDSWAEDSKGIVWGWQNRVGSRTEAAGR